MSKHQIPDESPSFPLRSVLEDLDGAAYLRASIGGALRGLAEYNGWGAMVAAKAMGASECHAEQILSSNLSDIPLEALVDMATFAGLELQLSIKLPESWEKLLGAGAFR